VIVNKLFITFSNSPYIIKIKVGNEIKKKTKNEIKKVL